MTVAVAPALTAPGYDLVGVALACGPADLALSVGAVLRVPFDPALLPNGRRADDVVLLHRDAAGAISVLLPTAVDGQAFFVETSVRVLGTFQAGVPSDAAKVGKLPDAARSSISVVPDDRMIVADGVDAARLTVSLRDAQGRPIVGMRVEWSVDDPQSVLTPDRGGLTAATGDVSATLTSRTGGEKTITAIATRGVNTTVELRLRLGVRFNAPPFVVAGADRRVVLVGQGADVALNGASFTDADGPTPHAATVRWGDGSTSPATIGPQGALAAAHRYTAEGSYQVTVEVRDGGGLVGRGAFALTLARTRLRGKVVARAGSVGALLPVRRADVQVGASTLRTRDDGTFELLDVAGAGLTLDASRATPVGAYAARRADLTAPAGFTTDVGALELAPPPPTGRAPALTARVVASQTGTNAITGGLLYQSLEYNAKRGNFLTVNTEGLDRLTEVTAPAAPGSPRAFRDIATQFGTTSSDRTAAGATGRDGVSLSCVADLVYVTTRGNVDSFAPATLGGTRRAVARNFAMPSSSTKDWWPSTETDEQGNLIARFGRDWWRITPLGGASLLFSAGAPEAQDLVRSETTNVYYSGFGTGLGGGYGEVRTIDVGRVGQTGTGTITKVHTLAGAPLDLEVHEPTQDLYWIHGNWQNFLLGGSDIWVTRGATPTTSCKVWTVPATFHAFGLTFAPATADATKTSLYVLQSDTPEPKGGGGARVNVQLVELAGLFDQVFAPLPDGDQDGVADEDEVRLGTDPRAKDTDRDGLEDGAELVNLGTDPTRRDGDGDGVDDDRELAAGTDPNDPTVRP